jgi:hypothetical protein
MKFKLVYFGDLRASANASKPEDVKRIRDKLHPQLKQLWKTHIALKRLVWSARVARNPREFFGDAPSSPLEDISVPPPPLQEGFVNLIEPQLEGGKTYIPLVRKSLELACSMEIQFLRKEDPGELVFQGGDLDGRIKTLFDALRKPSISEAAGMPSEHEPLYCLLESDTLISGFDVTTDRLLTATTEKANEVHLIIDVTIRALHVGPWNVCLLGN